MLTPSQAAQIMLEGTLDAGTMSVCGVDAVVSPPVGAMAEDEGLGAMVAAKGSVSAMVSRAGIRVQEEPAACRIRVAYGMGAAIAAPMAARIVAGAGCGVPGA